MRILFIQTGSADELNFDTKNNKFFNDFISITYSKTTSKAFLILKALTPENYTVEIIQTINPDDVNYDENYNLIGISSVTRHANLAYKIADRFRAKGVKVVLGGWHPSVLPQEAKQHADAVVIGEAEETWPQLIKDFENGKLKSFYNADRPIDLSLVPFDKIIDPLERSFKIYATRGCPHGCEYCSITNTKFGNTFRKRPIDDVIKEIKMHSRKQFIFNDASLTIDVSYTKQLFRQLKNLNKKFFALGNINILGRDEEFLKLANDAGCYAWYIGFESINQETLNNIKKKTNDAEDYIKFIKKIKNYGMSIFGSFMFGFDLDNLKTFDDTYDFIRKSEMDITFFHILTPFPGTPLYKKYESENRILTKDWDKYDLNHVVFQPKNITQEGLLQNVFDMHKNFYSTSNTIKRIINSLKLGLYPFLNSGFTNLAIWNGTRLTEKKFNIKNQMI